MLHLLQLLNLMGLALVNSVPGQSGTSPAARHPNVILIMADDLGIGDITPTNPNCKIETTHLQQLADDGLTLLDAHSPSSVCTPRRFRKRRRLKMRHCDSRRWVRKSRPSTFSRQ